VCGQRDSYDTGVVAINVIGDMNSTCNTAVNNVAINTKHFAKSFLTGLKERDE